MACSLQTSFMFSSILTLVTDFVDKNRIFGNQNDHQEKFEKIKYVNLCTFCGD